MKALIDCSSNSSITWFYIHRSYTIGLPLWLKPVLDCVISVL